MKLNALPKGDGVNSHFCRHTAPPLTLQDLDRWAAPKERHSLFRFGAFIAARVRRPSINVGNRPPTLDGDKLSRNADMNVAC